MCFSKTPVRFYGEKTETNSLAFKMFLLKKDPDNLHFPLEFQKRSICKYKYNSNICNHILARLNYWRHAIQVTFIALYYYRMSKIFVSIFALLFKGLWSVWFLCLLCSPKFDKKYSKIRSKQYNLMYFQIYCNLFLLWQSCISACHYSSLQCHVIL